MDIGATQSLLCSKKRHCGEIGITHASVSLSCEVRVLILPVNETNQRRTIEVSQCWFHVGKRIDRVFCILHRDLHLSASIQDTFTKTRASAILPGLVGVTDNTPAMFSGR